MSALSPRGTILSPLPPPRWPATLRGRVLIAAVAFAIAFALDVATDRRWSSLWGSAAILASLLAVAPKARAYASPVGAYAAVWVLFNLLRAVADDTGWTGTLVDVVPGIEARLFAGRLPAAILQGSLFDPARPRWHDLFLTAVHLSFFVVPHLVAVVLLWRDRACFWRYLRATAIAFAVGVAAFTVLPSNPPWLAAPTHGPAVQRVADVVLADLGVPLIDATTDRPEQRYAFEPNPIASTPSIHVAVTVLLAFVASIARRRYVATVTYAALMAFALVYLGEHHLLDVAAGTLLAALAWRFAAPTPIRVPTPALSGRRPAASGPQPSLLPPDPCPLTPDS